MQYEVMCSLIELFGQRTPEKFSADVLDAVLAFEFVLRERGVSATIKVTDVKAGRKVLDTVIIDDALAGDRSEGIFAENPLSVFAFGGSISASPKRL